MNSVQENKNELEAAVRYCESAISRAKATIESMEFRQQAASKAWHEQTGRESALEHAVNDLKIKYDKMKDYADKLLDENGDLEEARGRAEGEVELLQREIASLEREVKRLKGIIAEGNNVIDESRESRADLLMQIEGHRTNMALLSDEIATLKDQLAEREDKWDEAQTQLVEEKDRSMQYTNEIEILNDQIEELGKAYNDEIHETNVWKKAHQEQRELVALRDDQIAMLERRLAKYTGDKVYPFKEGDLYYVFNQLDGTWIESVWDDESERIHDAPSLPDHPHKVYFTIDQKNVLDKFKIND